MTDTLPIPAQWPLPLAALDLPPMLAGEESAEYQSLLARLSDAIKPADAIEQIRLNDVVVLVWDMVRLRRMKVDLLMSNRHQGVERVLRPAYNATQAAEMARNWSMREPASGGLVDDHLAVKGLTMRAVMAETLAAQLDQVERIERMIADAERRRDAILREIERRRASFAGRLRSATDEVEDAEFEVVADPAPAGAAA